MDILLIEDDSQISELLERFLRRKGHDVVSCADGAAGLTAYKERYFPVVICDIVMPRMTGIDFLHAIAGAPRREDSSVLLMTAHANVESAIAALKLGAYDYFTKPINLSELTTVLERISAAKQLTGELAKSRDELIDSEARFRAVLEHSLDAAYRRNLQTDTYDYVGPAIEDISGDTVQEWMDMSTETVINRIHPDDIRHLGGNMSQAMAAGLASNRIEYRFKHRDGKYRWIEDLSVVVPDASGKPLYRVGSIRDTTERKHAEKMLKTSYTRMKRNDLLNELVGTENMPEQQACEMLMEAGLKLTGPLTCYLVVLHEWKGHPRDYWRQHMEELHYLQDVIIDNFSEDDIRLAWRGPDGVGVLHCGPACELEGKEYQAKVTLGLQEELERRIPELTVQIGVSELSIKASGIYDQYQQCCTAIKLGKRIWPEERIYHYLDMGVYQVFSSGGNTKHIAAYIERTLGKLLRHETKRKGEYFATLEALLESSNLTGTAKKLFIHSKTLEYRKKRIEEILGVSLDNSDARLALAMALKLMKLGVDH